MNRHRIGGDAEQLEFSRESTPCGTPFFMPARQRGRKHPKKGVKHLALTKKLLNALGIDAEKIEQIIEAHTPIVPIYTYEPENTLIKQKGMYDQGVYVNSVLPPACPPGE